MDIRKKCLNLLQLAKSYHRVFWGVLALLFLCLFSSWFFFAQENSGTAEAATEIEQLANNIRRYYQNRPDYWGLSTQMVLDKNIYPNKMLENNQLVGHFGNPVLVGNGLNADVLMPGSRHFDIIYKDLNKKQCVGLASFKFSRDFWLGISEISVISDGQSQAFTWDDEKNGLPMQKNRAKAVCKGNNTIIWHYEQ